MMPTPGGEFPANSEVTFQTPTVQCVRVQAGGRGPVNLSSEFEEPSKIQGLSTQREGHSVDDRRLNAVQEKVDLKISPNPQKK
jgi:hypothetical protein